MDLTCPAAHRNYMKKATYMYISRILRIVLRFLRILRNQVGVMTKTLKNTSDLKFYPLKIVGLHAECPPWELLEGG